MQGEDAVVGVVLPAQERGEVERADLLGQVLDLAFDLRDEALVLLLVAHGDEGVRVLALGAQVRDALGSVGDGLDALVDLLRALEVVPEVRLLHLAVELVQLVAHGVHVKGGGGFIQLLLQLAHFLFKSIQFHDHLAKLPFSENSSASVSIFFIIAGFPAFGNAAP